MAEQLEAQAPHADLMAALGEEPDADDGLKSTGLQHEAPLLQHEAPLLDDGSDAKPHVGGADDADEACAVTATSEGSAAANMQSCLPEASNGIKVAEATDANKGEGGEPADAAETAIQDVHAPVTEGPGDAQGDEPAEDDVTESKEALELQHGSKVGKGAGNDSGIQGGADVELPEEGQRQQDVLDVFSDASRLQSEAAGAQAAPVLDSASEAAFEPTPEESELSALGADDVVKPPIEDAPALPDTAEALQNAAEVDADVTLVPEPAVIGSTPERKAPNGGPDSKNHKGAKHPKDNDGDSAPEQEQTCEPGEAAAAILETVEESPSQTEPKHGAEPMVDNGSSAPVPEKAGGEDAVPTEETLPRSEENVKGEEACGQRAETEPEIAFDHDASKADARADSSVGQEQDATNTKEQAAGHGDTLASRDGLQRGPAETANPQVSNPAVDPRQDAPLPPVQNETTCDNPSTLPEARSLSKMASQHEDTGDMSPPPTQPALLETPAEGNQSKHTEFPPVTLAEHLEPITSAQSSSAGQLDASATIHKGGKYSRAQAGADSADDLRRNSMLFSVGKGSNGVRTYLDATVVPVLRKGLRELVRHKPADPCEWLAQYLQTHKPRAS